MIWVSGDALAPAQRCASGLSGCAARGPPPKQGIGRGMVSAIGSQDSFAAYAQEGESMAHVQRSVATVR